MQKRKKQKTASGYRKLNLVTQKHAPFNYREAYKSLRTNLKFISATEDANSFVITSALQMESKSNIAVNLSITLAEEGKNVILVDCDFRKPILHRFLGLDGANIGITNVLMGDCKVTDAIQPYSEQKLDVLPAGTIPPNPTELLSSEKMKGILNMLKSQYDYVIIDTPPVSVVTDAAIVGGIADGALLVIRSDYAPVEIIELAKKKLEDVDVKIFGIILSRFNIKKTSRPSGYYYSYNDYYYSN